MVIWRIKERDITSHVPVIDNSGRDDRIFERADFSFDAEINLDICPAGKELKQLHRTYKTPKSGVDRHRIMPYRARKKDCDPCAFKMRCCLTQSQRKVTHSIHELSRDVARAIAQTTQYAMTCKLRKKLRCSSHISNASLALAGPNYAVPAAHETNSTSPQLPITSENSKS